jgi:CDP-paratose 2-epimerase
MELFVFQSFCLTVFLSFSFRATLLTILMKLLVFGGIGFIGTNICLTALSRGHQVIAFDNLSRTGVVENLAVLSKQKHFTFLHGDVRCAEDFYRIPKGVDVIINLAANPAIPVSIDEPLYDFTSNVVGHMHILEYSRTHGSIPVILASSNKAYTDEINALPIVEDKTRYHYKNKKLEKGFDETVDVSGHRGFTNSPYGAGKLADEKYTREYWKHYQIPMVINRMSCIYGLYQKGVADQGWVDHFLRVKKYGGTLTLFGTGKQVRDVLFSTDVANLYVYEAEHMDKVNGMTFNVGGGAKSGFNTSLLELITLIDTNFPGEKLKFEKKPWRESDQRIYISDIHTVTKATGWKPTVNLLSGLKQMWEHYDA